MIVLRPVGSGTPSVWPVRNLTTLPAVVRSKNGRMQSTELSLSSPGTRRASGLRTMRPSSCVMWVWSLAGRNDTITSARGQSQPVEIASLATSTRTCSASWTRWGSIQSTSHAPNVCVEWSPKTWRTASESRSGNSAKISSSARPSWSGSGVFGAWSTSSGCTISGEPCVVGVLLPSASLDSRSLRAARRTSTVSKLPASAGMSRTTVSLTSPDSWTRNPSTVDGRERAAVLSASASAIASLKRSMVAEMPQTIGIGG